ncbi:MAG: Glu/Leu/Phe/Val dehydrogenase [Myxococcales bacterium]|nr:Glu/Leu/Phe/Val dehydrogenase [Polyangiaceae bacterium]MDW8250079.1 Glu/Leu/Phe/Val dehydrogenase [Myxococcales bacterium]
MSQPATPPVPSHELIPPPPPSASPDAPVSPLSFSSIVAGYIEQGARVLGVDDFITTILKEPANELIIHFPVRMSNGSTRLFKGYRVQHSNALGPFKGGIRFHESVTLDTCRAVAAIATIQCALMKLPFGGGSGGIKFDPRSVSEEDLQRISRRFFFAFGNNVGPESDVAHPDLGTSSKIMAWGMDTYANTIGNQLAEAARAVVTGKPLAIGGIEGRERASGQGIVHVIRQWADEHGLDLAGATMATLGFGNVGSQAAMLLAKLGVSTVAVGDHSGFLLNEEGLNPHKLHEYAARHGSIAGYPGGRSISREEFFSTRTDIFLPAALHHQIGSLEASMLRPRLIVEGAYGPLTPEAEAVLVARGVDILPDVLANAGGAIVSYFEWAQNRRSESWPVSVTEEKLERRMKQTYREISQLARARGLSLRIAAYAIALGRLQAVYRERDLFPLLGSWADLLDFLHFLDGQPEGKHFSGFPSLLPTRKPHYRNHPRLLTQPAKRYLPRAPAMGSSHLRQHPQQPSGSGDLCWGEPGLSPPSPWWGWCIVVLTG